MSSYYFDCSIRHACPHPTLTDQISMPLVSMTWRRLGITSGLACFHLTSICQKNGYNRFLLSGVTPPYPVFVFLCLVIFPLFFHLYCRLTIATYVQVRKSISAVLASLLCERAAVQVVQCLEHLIQLLALVVVLLTLISASLNLAARFACCGGTLTPRQTSIYHCSAFYEGFSACTPR